MKKLTNLEIIKKAWGMRWSAVLKLVNKEYHVIHIGKKYITLNTLDEIEIKSLKGGLWSIVGFLYTGQLGGNEPIPEGTRFKDGAGDILTFNKLLKNSVIQLRHEKGGLYEYCREEIQPVFNQTIKNTH